MINISQRLQKLIGSKDEVFKENIEGETIQQKALELFSNIYGLDDMKENMYRALISKDQINVLLVGPPATSKTLFMFTMYEHCKDSIYFNAADGGTGAGLIERLFNNQKAKLLIVDEIDKLKRNDQNTLLGLLNNGRVDKDLKSQPYHFSMNVKIFATSNSLTKLSKPLKSRFQEYRLPEYTDDEFVKVVQFCLMDKLSYEKNEIIALTLLNNNRKDVRTAISISNLIQPNDSIDDILRIIENWLKYSTESGSNVDYN